MREVTRSRCGRPVALQLVNGRAVFTGERGIYQLSFNEPTFTINVLAFVVGKPSAFDWIGTGVENSNGEILTTSAYVSERTEVELRSEEVIEFFDPSLLVSHVHVVKLVDLPSSDSPLESPRR